MKEVVTSTMRYTFDYNAKSSIVEVCATGTMGDDAFTEVANMFCDELKEHNCYKALIDYRASIFKASILGIYNRPAIASEAGVTTRVKMAFLVKSIDDNHRFLETVYLNRGFIVKLFTNSEDAMLWFSCR